MGLDITAYSNLVHVGHHVVVGWCDDEGHVKAFAFDVFPQSFRGIPVLTTERYGDTTVLEGGCYEITDLTETYRFQAGSYTGHNLWREDLQEQFNPARDPEGPFYELIWFADNEGTIGPEAALDLLADFREHADKYEPKCDSDLERQYQFQRYRDWTRACELASQDGLIRFH